MNAESAMKTNCQKEILQETPKGKLDSRLIKQNWNLLPQNEYNNDV